MMQKETSSCPTCAYAGERLHVRDIGYALAILVCPDEWHKAHTRSNNFGAEAEEQ